MTTSLSLPSLLPWPLSGSLPFPVSRSFNKTLNTQSSSILQSHIFSSTIPGAFLARIGERHADDVSQWASVKASQLSKGASRIPKLATLPSLSVYLSLFPIHSLIIFFFLFLILFLASPPVSASLPLSTCHRYQKFLSLTHLKFSFHPSFYTNIPILPLPPPLFPLIFSFLFSPSLRALLSCLVLAGGVLMCRVATHRLVALVVMNEGERGKGVRRPSLLVSRRITSEAEPR